MKKHRELSVKIELSSVKVFTILTISSILFYIVRGVCFMNGVLVSVGLVYEWGVGERWVGL